MATLGHMEFTVEVNTDKLKIAQLESQLELLGHAAQQVIGTAQGSFWLGRDRMSVSAYTIDQLRKLVGYEWNDHTGRFGMDDASRELARVRAELDACKTALTTARKRVDKKDAADGEAGREYWLRQYNELAHASHVIRERIKTLEADNKSLQEANDTLSRAAGGPDAGQLRDEIAKLKLRLDAAAATIKNVDLRNAKLVGDLAKANERIAMLKANLANAGNQLLAVAKA